MKDMRHTNCFSWSLVRLFVPVVTSCCSEEGLIYWLKGDKQGEKEMKSKGQSEVLLLWHKGCM